METKASATARYREEYRSRHIGSGYRGGFHLAFTAIFSLGGIILAVFQLEAVRLPEWLVIPLTFLYANLAEYLGHRYFMHRARPGLKAVFHRHTVQHHRFFTHEDMALDSARDYRAVLFPPVLVIFFFGVFAFPVGMLIAWLGSPNAAWLFVATALAYFLNYELLHLAYHMPEDSRWLKVPLIRRLRRLHHRHHDPALMTTHNFNITYPVCDWLFRTQAVDMRARIPGESERP